MGDEVDTLIKDLHKDWAAHETSPINNSDPSPANVFNKQPGHEVQQEMSVALDIVRDTKLPDLDHVLSHVQQAAGEGSCDAAGQSLAATSASIRASTGQGIAKPTVLVQQAVSTSTQERILLQQNSVYVKENTSKAVRDLTKLPCSEFTQQVPAASALFRDSKALHVNQLTSCIQ